MNFIKRAWEFTLAKKGRTGVLIAVFTAILVFVMAGLTIQSATNTASTNAKKSVGATVTLSVNREAMMGDRTSGEKVDRTKIEMPTITAATAEKIASSSEVKSASYSTSATATETDSFKAMKSEETSTESSSTEAGKGFGGMPGGNSQMASADFRITGTNDLSAVSSFSGGTDSITSGRGIDSSDKGTNHVVIEETLASLNSVKVGDKIKITNTDSKTVELEIVGIYKSGSTETDEMSMRIASMNPVNTMYTYYTQANTIAGNAEDTISSAVFNLKDPDKMSTFVKNAEKNIDTEKFQLQTNDEMYQQMLTPLNNVASFSKNIVLLVAIAGAIILTLIVILQIRERKFEIGVLMSLGEDKFKIIGQFFVELFIVMIVSASLSGIFGNVVGNVVGQQLLTQQNETAQTTQESQTSKGGPGQGAPSGGPSGGFGGGMRGAFGMNQSQQEVQQIKNLNVKTTPKTFGILVAIAIGITILSILLASIGILRMQPKSILTSN